VLPLVVVLFISSMRGCMHLGLGHVRMGICIIWEEGKTLYIIGRIQKCELKHT